MTRRYPYQFIDFNQPLVDPTTGRISPYFQRQLFGQTENAQDVSDEVDQFAAAIAALQNEKADKATLINTGFGLSGGGDLSADRTLSLGNPALVDPNEDRILFWDDSLGQLRWLKVGTNLTITDDTISASGGGSGGATGIGSFNSPGAASLPTTRVFGSSSLSVLEQPNKGLAMIYLSENDGRSCGRFRTPPSLPYCVTLRGIAWSGLRNAAPSELGFGIALRNSTSGRVVPLYTYSDSLLYLQNWSSLNTFSGNIASGPPASHLGRHLSLHYAVSQDAGGSIRFFYSLDGVSWEQIGSALTPSAFITATGGAVDEVGAFLFTAPAPRRVYGFIEYLRVETGVSVPSAI